MNTARFLKYVWLFYNMHERVNDLPQSLSESGSYLYIDHSCIFYQDKVIYKIEDNLNKECLTLCKWFVDNKLSIHFGVDKTNSILFSKIKRSSKLNMPEENIIRNNTIL